MICWQMARMAWQLQSEVWEAHWWLVPNLSLGSHPSSIPSSQSDMVTHRFDRSMSFVQALLPSALDTAAGVESFKTGWAAEGERILAVLEYWARAPHIHCEKFLDAFADFGDVKGARSRTAQCYVGHPFSAQWRIILQYLKKCFP